MNVFVFKFTLFLNFPLSVFRVQMIVLLLTKYCFLKLRIENCYFFFKFLWTNLGKRGAIYFAF